MRRAWHFHAAILFLHFFVPHAFGQTRPLELSVDATEAPRRLLHAKMKIPVSAGPLTLYYPKWIQGEHSANGPINDLAGIKLMAAGKPIPWRRDDVDLYAFHCVIPTGVDTLEVALDYLGSGKGDNGGIGGSSPCMTSNLAILSWHMVLLYPQGQPVRDLKVQADVTLPKGWKLGTALPVESVKGAATQFKTVSLETLADSPVLCGRFFKEVSLGVIEGKPHFLTLACESAAGLELSAELKKHYEKLVVEAGLLFGARHYGSYRFLVAMSDFITHNGLEHHECSDNRVPEKFLVEDSYRKTWHAWLLSHEYVHSWNGKYRRPAGLDTPDFQKPMRTNLLWVYEGLTEYLGFVLAARSGLNTPEIARENLAIVGEWARTQRGRAWRSLEDTATTAPHLYFTRSDWSSRRRGTDFYDEGALLWLDVDTLIREKSAGKKSLDDFCRLFFGGKNSLPEVKPYTVKDVAEALSAIVPHDWQAFLDRRVTLADTEPPLDGITRGGWTLTHRDTPGDLYKARESDEKTLFLNGSIGMVLGEEGKVIDVIPGKAADKAGVGPGMKIIAVNDRRFSSERFTDAVSATAKGKEKLRLLIENQEFFSTVTLNYAEGARYPELVRSKNNPDYLSAILSSRAKP